MRILIVALLLAVATSQTGTTKRNDGGSPTLTKIMPHNRTSDPVRATDRACIQNHPYSIAMVLSVVGALRLSRLSSKIGYTPLQTLRCLFCFLCELNFSARAFARCFL